MKRWMARSFFWPTLMHNYAMGRVLRVRRWWDRVDANVILGALPFRRDATKLKNERVTGVINMCEEYAGPKARYEQLGIEQLWLPTVDFNHPSEESVVEGAEFIERHAKAGGTVYVHCKAGRARSATVVLWWFVRYRGMTPEAAQEHLLEARPHVNAKVYLRPVIQELYRKLKQDSLR
jgi:atypical dual specificity phosphatase